MAKKPGGLAIILGGMKGKPRAEDEDEDMGGEGSDTDEELRANLETFLDRKVDDEQLAAFRDACRLCYEDGERESLPPPEPEEE